MTRSIFGRDTKIVTFLRLVPKDGCLLIFNGNYWNWWQAARRLNLKCAIADSGSDRKYTKFRDLYIYKNCPENFEGS